MRTKPGHVFTIREKKASERDTSSGKQNKTIRVGANGREGV
jgi:hypothetical protein